MATRLHVVMTSFRPWNISKLSDAYVLDIDDHPFELRWHILCQGPERDPKGVRKNNEAIDFIKDGWIIFAADDTVQTPELYRRIGEVIEENPNAGCIMFAEERGDRTVHPRPEDAATGEICGGMMVVNREFIGDMRWDTNDPIHRSDGRFCAALYAKDPSRFVFVDEALTKENSLEWA